MHTKKKLSFVLGLFILFFCSSEKAKSSQIEVVIKEFPINKKLQSEAITTSEDVILYQSNLFTTQDYLITYNEKKELLFDVYQLPDLNYLFSDGKIGNGSNDFMRLDRNRFIATSNGFQVFFMGHKKLKEVTIDANNHTLKINDKNVVDLKYTSEGMINGLLPINNATFLTVSGFQKETEYDLYSTTSKSSTPFYKKTSISPYPEWGGEQKEDKLFTYIKSSVLKPDSSRFAASYVYFKRLRIYSDNGSLLKDISVETPPFEDNIDSNVEDRKKYYYTHLRTTTNHIYAFCRNGKTSDEQTETELHIWTWDGEPVACYTLDRRLALFTISEKYKKIYAVDNKSDDIYVYPLLHL